MDRIDLIVLNHVYLVILSNTIYTGELLPSIDSDYFYVMTDPVRWKVYPATIAAHPYLLFDHLLTINLELHLALGHLRDVLLTVF